MDHGKIKKLGKEITMESRDNFDYGMIVEEHEDTALEMQRIAEVSQSSKRGKRSIDPAFSKSLGDPWQIVPHTHLSERKITVGGKPKGKFKGIKVTSLKKFLKFPNDIVIEHKPISQRRAIPIQGTQESITQVIKKALKDYNSIAFLMQNHRSS
ncbi:MAG: hypothetical protein LBB11_03240 [Puniceicoccales bacterium]|jgi:hypothetical protein|nr:hypothetical protein [Puniceicoccales bacterium]